MLHILNQPISFDSKLMCKNHCERFRASLSE